MTDLDQLDALHAAATPGEWYQLLVSDFLNEEPEDIDIRGLHGALVATALVDAGLAQYRANASYIVGAHNAWPAISKELRELRVERDQLIADNDRLRLALKSAVEAIDEGYLQDARGLYECSECGSGGTDRDLITHSDECLNGQLRAALSARPPDAVRKYEARVKAEVWQDIVAYAKENGFGHYAGDTDRYLSVPTLMELAEAALSAPPPDAVKRHEARVKEEAMRELIAKADSQRSSTIAAFGDVSAGDILGIAVEMIEAARRESSDG